MLKRVEKPEWLRIAEEFEASELTQREFAQRRGVPLGTLQSWVYRRRRQGSAAPPPPVRLLPVQVSAALVAREGGRVEVTTGSGVRVGFAPGTDVDYVARLVAALERPSC
jgi:transposase